MIVVLEREGRLLGHYAVQPREFWIAERRATVGFAVGTMVLPEVRSVAALVDLAEQAYVLCRERGFPWLYAFPNDQAHHVQCAFSAGGRCRKSSSGMDRCRRRIGRLPTAFRSGVQCPINLIGWQFFHSRSTGRIPKLNPKLSALLVQRTG